MSSYSLCISLSSVEVTDIAPVFSSMLNCLLSLPDRIEYSRRLLMSASGSVAVIGFIYQYKDVAVGKNLDDDVMQE